MSNPALIDQAIYELRTNFFEMSKQINTTKTNSHFPTNDFKITSTSPFLFG
jgi:hypothetical protein